MILSWVLCAKQNEKAIQTLFEKLTIKNRQTIISLEHMFKEMQICLLSLHFYLHHSLLQVSLRTEQHIETNNFNSLGLAIGIASIIKKNLYNIHINNFTSIPFTYPINTSCGSTPDRGN